MSTSRGNTCEKPGINNTSSKVNPSPKNLFDFVGLDCEALRIVAMCKDIGRAKYHPNEFCHCLARKIQDRKIQINFKFQASNK